MFGILRYFFKMLRQEQPQQPPPPSKPVSADRLSTVKTQALGAADVAAHMQSLPRAKVVYVCDGDTVIVARGLDETKIRLDSIDCPEDGQHWGDTAKHGLIKLIGGQRVALEEHGHDVHGRTLATIYVRHKNGDEWQNVNERMVTLGHAWVMRAYYDHLPKDRQAKLDQLETWAKSKKAGLWNTQNPIPPWQWRKRGSITAS